MNKLSIRERREQFIFLTAIFILSISVLSYGVLHGFGRHRVISRSELLNELAIDAEFERVVSEQRPAVDTVYTQINRFDPGVQAVFLENDIRNTLEAIKSNYERHSADPRYKTFLQVSMLYNYLFINRRELRGNYSDISRLDKSLQDCKLSTRELKSTIGSQFR